MYGRGRKGTEEGEGSGGSRNGGKGEKKEGRRRQMGVGERRPPHLLALPLSTL